MTMAYKNKIGPGIRRLDAWLREIGRSLHTGYRWRKRGWIKVLNIGGRWYITDEEIERFITRGKEGEFFSRTLEATTTANLKRRCKAQFQKYNTQ